MKMKQRTGKRIVKRTAALVALTLLLAAAACAEDAGGSEWIRVQPDDSIRAAIAIPEGARTAPEHFGTTVRSGTETQGNQILANPGVNMSMLPGQEAVPVAADGKAGILNEHQGSLGFKQGMTEQKVADGSAKGILTFPGILDGETKAGLISTDLMAPAEKTVIDTSLFERERTKKELVVTGAEDADEFRKEQP